MGPPNLCELAARTAYGSVLFDEGHVVMYQSVKEDGWAEALAELTELIVVAGGDE